MDAGPVIGKTTTTISSTGTSKSAIAADAPSLASSLAASPSSPGRGKLQDKLLPRSITGSRRWKRTRSPSLSSTADPDSNSMPRGRSRGRGAAAGDLAGDVTGDDDRGHSDDDILLRPRRSSQPSQIGHSATSSPLVPTELPQEIRVDDIDRLSPSASFLPDQPAHRSQSFVSREPSPNLESPASSLPSSKTSLAPPASKHKNRRTPSPGGRFRNVFKKKSPAASIASTGSQSPERHHPGHPDDTVPDDTVTPLIQLPSDARAHQHDIKVAPSERFRRLSRGHKVDTNAPPKTPPTSVDDIPPVIVNTPPTPIESNLLGSATPARPQTAVNAPRDASHGIGSGTSPNSLGNSMLAQRRNRANSASLVPSKLSNYTLAPLTPTPENPTTPSASGFFSTVFSAAQTATNSLSSSITPWSNPAKKPTSGKDDDANTAGADEDEQSQKENGGVEVESSLGPSLVPSESAEAKEPAIKTLGQGDLSLSQLGIADQPPKPKTNPAPSGSSSPAVVALTSALSSSNQAAMGTQSPVAGTRASAESRSRSESAPPDNSAHVNGAAESVEHDSDYDKGYAAGGHHGSSSDFNGHDTPPMGSLTGDKIDPAQRTNSIKSAIDRRRNRGSSAVSGGTIAAAIASANASLAHPHNGSTPKLTGFAVASKKRNRDFHNLFKSVPDDDYLIEDYSCALQREILAHGRLYVSEGHLCFSSNILGWVTTLVMSFDEIVSVEKRSTALVFKNGLMISTLHAKHIFASFASRDSTYDLIVKIWKLGHPSLQSSVNGVHIDETGGDKTEKIEQGEAEEASTGSRSASESEIDSDDEDDDVYDEDDDDDDMYDAAQSSDPAINGSGGSGDADNDRVVTRKVSGPAAVAAGGAGGGGNGGGGGGGSDKTKDAAAAGGAGADFGGPLTHAPTDCGDASSHFDKILADEVIPAPLGKVFSFMFGAASVTFMPKWLSTDQKCFDIQMGDKKALSQEVKTRTFSYIKPLNASIGPKQTKCIVTEQIEVLDYEKAIHILCSTSNPDVPNGNIFTVKTKYCLSWGEGNGTRVQMNCTTEWTGKSWIKVPIEKAANEGQAQYGRELFAGLKEALSSRARAATGPGKSGGGGGGGGGKANGGKKGRKGKTAQATSSAANGTEGSSGAATAHKGAATASDWGMFEPVHGIVGPVVDILQPLLTGNVMYGLLVGLLVASWFGFRSGGGGGGGGVDGAIGAAGPGMVGGMRRGHFVGGGGGGYLHERQVTYDEMWRREESELWDWLEERVGLDRLGKNDYAAGSAQQQFQQRARAERHVQDAVRDERMDERQIREAIRVTEEKLRVLKEVVEKREAQV